MTAPDIPAALARLAVDMERLADLVRLCGNEPAFAERVKLAGEGGEIWERAQDELTHNRVAALVAEVIAWRNQADMRKQYDDYVPPPLRETATCAELARAATDKAFGG